MNKNVLPVDPCPQITILCTEASFCDIFDSPHCILCMRSRKCNKILEMREKLTFPKNIWVACTFLIRHSRTNELPFLIPPLLFSGTDFAGPPSYTVTSPRPSVDNTASGM